MSTLMSILLAAVALPSPSRAAVLHQSSFAALPDGVADLADWALSGAEYKIEDGWLTVKSEQTNPYAALKVRHDGDGTFRATVRNARDCHWSAILARGVYRLEINNQFVRLGLHRLIDDEWQLVDEAKDYSIYPHNTQAFELRLAIVGNRLHGFIDDKKLVEYEDTAPVPADGDYALMSGWGTNLAWTDTSLSDEPDLSEWPYEVHPAPAPEGLAEVTWVRWMSPDSIYVDGEPAGLKFRLKNPVEEPTDLVLRYRLIDIWQRTVDEKSESVSLAGGEEREFQVTFTPPARGCFKIALYAGRSADDMGWLEDLGSFTVLPEALYDAPSNPNSYFGGHMDGINLEWHLQAGRKIGIQWARCHDALQTAWWERIQPDGPDQWLWPYDGAQTRLDALGFSTLGEFCKTPTWASSAKPDDPGHPRQYPPGDWEAFARYVFTTVNHYKGSIKHWEVWNEPHYAGFWRGTPEQYAELLQIAYREAKRADPECLVIGGGGVWARRLDWIERMLDAGGVQSMDALSIHYAEPDIARELMPKLRELLDSHGVTGPIWNSEANIPSTSFLDQIRREKLEPEARYHFRNACFELVRMYMENIANGVERVFYYAQVDPWRQQTFPKPRVFEDSPAEGGMWDEGRMLKPIAAAHAALALAIEGKTFKTRISRGDLEVFIFEADNSATAVQYATFDSFSRREQLRLPLPEGAQAEDLTVIDVMGNESRAQAPDGEIVLLLAREPVYLLYGGERAGEALRSMYAAARKG